MFTIPLLDGTSMLHRALHAAPPTLAADGAEVGAVLGLVSQLVALMRKARTGHWIMVFDAPGPCFRHRIDASYKAGRPPPPPELTSQLELAVSVCGALGLLTLQVDDVEADDVIATLTHLARAEGHDTWVVSPDKDLLQLVRDEQPSTAIFHPQTRQRIDEAAVMDRLGVSPAQAVAYFALTGDSSDNISGVKGVGPKAAQALISTFTSLDGVYAHLDDVPNLGVRGAKALQRKLEDGREGAYLAQRLLCLRTDVTLDIHEGPLAASARWHGITPESRPLFDRLGDHQPLDKLEDVARRRGL